MEHCSVVQDTVNFWRRKTAKLTHNVTPKTETVTLAWVKGRRSKDDNDTDLDSLL